MTEHQIPSERLSRRRGHGCLVWLGRTALLVLVLVMAGVVYESTAEAADLRAYPPPGQLIDVGGFRLHLNCAGTGSPTVVVDAGWGDWSVMWNMVQQKVAATTQICTYDRAGSGWSETGPQPRNAKVFAQELHNLLANAHVPGPYLLVGHSMGGFTMRVFAHDFPTDTAGLVLIESMSPAQMSAASPSSASANDSGGVSLPALAARAGIVRLLAGPLGLDVPLSPEAAKRHLAFSVTPRAIQAVMDEGNGMGASGTQAAAVTSLGNLPLIVLTARLNAQQSWQTNQTDLLQLSANSLQLFAENSGHNIELDQPDAAVDAIVKMVSTIGNDMPLTP